MRIKQNKLNNLKNSITLLLPNSKIYLFGSRVDDSKKGGDIDILILGIRKLTWREKSKIELEFFKNFGEQKLDLVSFSYKDNDPFKKIALSEGVLL